MGFACVLKQRPHHPAARVILQLPADMEEARRRLLLLSGRTHNMNVAVVPARGGKPPAGVIKPTSPALA